ncbi:MAG: FAD-dependent oxidoreductase [Candidatus Lokiarchaeota archaeon]|nr:FAD-dependent oxidoreductase [Candidatus Lokiarchaeota archaeon]
MKVVIVGNNVAGTFTAQNIRYLNEDVDIEIYTQESYPYYTRVNLPELIPEKVQIDDLIVFKDDWYKNNNIKLNLNCKVIKIEPDQKNLFIEGQSNPISYDKLVLALGSVPNIPPIKNAREMVGKGVFTLRTIDDALEIKEYIQNVKAKKALIIGGGLLGLELANQIKNANLDTTVVEFFPRLLPRQLDDECSGMLKNEIESKGINVVLNATTEEIMGNGAVTGIKLKDGQRFDADIVLIQAGIRATIDLAQNSGLETNRGIIVDEFLETSKKNIFAVGDCVEYKNQTWGIIPACMEQSKIVAASVLGLKKIEYKGTTPKNTLKIVGMELTSIGIFDPSKEEGGGWDILKRADKNDCCYQKLILKGNTLKGAILYGDNKAMPFVYKKMEQDVTREELMDILELYVYICSNCGAEYDETKREILFKDLPDDWKCPNCKHPKEGFKKQQHKK